jgi:hypothetical protein
MLRLPVLVTLLVLCGAAPKDDPPISTCDGLDCLAAVSPSSTHPWIDFNLGLIPPNDGKGKWSDEPPYAGCTPCKPCNAGVTLIYLGPASGGLGWILTKPPGGGSLRVDQSVFQSMVSDCNDPDPSEWHVATINDPNGQYFDSMTLYCTCTE